MFHVTRVFMIHFGITIFIVCYKTIIHFITFLCHQTRYHIIPHPIINNTIMAMAGRMHVPWGWLCWESSTSEFIRFDIFLFQSNKKPFGRTKLGILSHLKIHSMRCMLTVLHHKSQFHLILEYPTTFSITSFVS